MTENNRLSKSTDWIDSEFVEREHTPCEIVKKGIRHHLTELSLSNTVMLLEESGVTRSRTAIHNWVQKADLEAVDDESPDQVAVDQKVIRINDEQYWLYAAVDPGTNNILHSRLFPTYTIAIAEEFLAEVTEKHDVEDAVFLIDDADDLIGGLRNRGLNYRVQPHGYRNERTCFPRGRTTDLIVFKLFQPRRSSNR